MAKAESQLFKPADACRMAEVAPYVLRYWETEFPALAEGKDRGAPRLYTARDVQIIARIRQLLYDEGFTVAGAKKRLESEISEGRFDDGEKAPSIAEQRRKAEERVELPEPRPVPKPTPVAAAPPPTPAPRPAPPPPVVAPPPPPPAPVRAAESSGFAERKTVIRELKEIVRLLDRSKKR
ncbi:MAG TPA: MerR family transcriptional regulator [Thermoanaerobaculia bacterium]|nr:MerR family transcriptional regulator [Thermoanaerobaculia bacterium]